MNNYWIGAELEYPHDALLDVRAARRRYQDAKRAMRERMRLPNPEWSWEGKTRAQSEYALNWSRENYDYVRRRFLGGRS